MNSVRLLIALLLSPILLVLDLILNKWPVSKSFVFTPAIWRWANPGKKTPFGDAVDGLSGTFRIILGILVFAIMAVVFVALIVANKQLNAPAPGPPSQGAFTR